MLSLHGTQRLLSAMAVAALLCTLPLSRSSAAEPYSIDVIMTQTGSNAFLGKDFIDTIHVFETLYNKKGGINGRPVHFEIHDDQSNPQVSVQIASELIVKHPTVILGSAQTAECGATAPLMISGPVEYCLSPGLNPPRGGYVFSSSGTGEYLAVAMLRFSRLKKYNRIAVISTIDASGQAAERATLQGFDLPENRSLKLVAQEHYNRSDLNATAQVARMKAATPDVIIVWATDVAFGTIMRSMRDAGWDIPVVTTAANLNRIELDQFGRFLPTNVYFNSYAYATRDTLPAGDLRNKIDEFYAAFREAGIRPTPGSGFAWDPLLILMASFQKLGTDVSATKLRDHILGLHDFAGISGIYDFRRGDQHGLTDASMTLVKWDSKTHDFTIATKLGGVPLP